MIESKCGILWYKKYTLCNCECVFLLNKRIPMLFFVSHLFGVVLVRRVLLMLWNIIFFILYRCLPWVVLFKICIHYKIECEVITCTNSVDHHVLAIYEFGYTFCWSTFSKPYIERICPERFQLFMFFTLYSYIICTVICATYFLAWKVDISLKVH